MPVSQVNMLSQLRFIGAAACAALTLSACSGAPSEADRAAMEAECTTKIAAVATEMGMSPEQSAGFCKCQTDAFIAAKITPGSAGDSDKTQAIAEQCLSEAGG